VLLDLGIMGGLFSVFCSKLKRVFDEVRFAATIITTDQTPVYLLSVETSRIYRHFVLLVKHVVQFLD
jgi:hypothetical protein